MTGKATRRTILLIAMAVLLTVSMVGAAFAGPGPAPNSGDCISDGSGFDAPMGSGVGGAPNSGDGVSDGSGW